MQKIHVCGKYSKPPLIKGWTLIDKIELAPCGCDHDGWRHCNCVDSCYLYYLQPNDAYLRQGEPLQPPSLREHEPSQA